MEFEFAKLGGSRLAELPCILHADEFKLRSFAAKPCNKRNEWHDMERSIVRWPSASYHDARYSVLSCE